MLDKNLKRSVMSEGLGKIMKSSEKQAGASRGAHADESNREYFVQKLREAENEAAISPTPITQAELDESMNHLFAAWGEWPHI